MATMSDNARIMWLTIVVAAIVQAAAVVCGMDYCDTGFYMTFYDNIFDAPETVEYNFMYYLSGLVGGAWLTVFPGWGIVGIRLLGMLANLLTVAMLFGIYRRVVPPVETAMGCLIVVMAYLMMPMAFYNDTLTAVMLVAGTGLLTRGLDRQRGWMIAIAGVVIGVNTFSRTPNLIDLLLVGLIPLHARLNDRRGVAARQSLVFIGGWIAGVAAVVALMALLGHLPIYLSNLGDLLGVAATGDASTGATHGFKGLIMAQVRAYISVARLVLRLLGLATLVSLTLWRVKWLWLRVPLLLLWGVWAFDLFAESRPVSLVAALVIPALVAGIFRFESPRARFASAAALAVALLFPLGSDGAMENNGSIVYWLGAPLAIGFYGKLLRTFVGQRRAMVVLVTVVAMLSGAMALKTIGGGVYFDGRPLWTMTTTPAAPRAAGVMTTAERAATVNEIVTAVESVAARGDTVMVFGSMPMINYLTATRPAMGCSWPELLSEPLLASRLATMKRPRAILVQRFATIGSDYKEPTPGFVEGTGEGAGTFHSEAKCGAVADYIATHGYKVAVSSPRFTLYIRR